ncbi:MAG: hypothetical protein A2144_08870 [Chloroflexi bacterium RBG_16_50_9]|nr:MAG: hypothetical protein A2144_08870 [Chloroflexi bacterium RBG_16_50_9]
MGKAREFNGILDECLERVLIRHETLEQCLKDYPELAADLEPLLRIALVAKKASEIAPPDEFREKARHQFQAAIRDMQSKKTRSFFNWQPRWATAVIVVLILLLAGSGTVAASSNSLPDEPLYTVKLATEAVQLALTLSPAGKAELYVKLADQRVAEIVSMAEKGRVEQLEETSERLDQHLLAVANLAGPGRGLQAFEASSEMTAAGEDTTRAQIKEEPAKVLAPAPAPAPAMETPAPTILVAPPADIEEAPAKGKPSLGAPKAPGLEKSTKTPGNRKTNEGINTDEQAELKKIVSARAEKNREALLSALERVPDSVKPALRQVIEAAENGYEQVLESLD